MTRSTRRDFLQLTTLAAASSLMPTWSGSTRTMAQDTKSPNERPIIGCIGNGGMGTGDAHAIKGYGDIVALCDVDTNRSGNLNEKLLGGKAEVFGDYKKLLDRKDIDAVTISTPDHWHTRIALAALRAGKDIYCQKPLTLTINEGKLLCKIVKETKRVMQVGTQQRSDDRFQKAVAIAREGRIGKIQKVHIAIGGGDKGPTFKKTQPPANLNWDVWLGQAPLVEYIAERSHNNFRWWYEYSGGKMTDWGAHHVDIAQWGIRMENSGPVSVEVLECTHPVPFEKGYPTIDDTYNTATAFKVKATFANGVEMFIRDNCNDLGFDNGVMFEGETGRFFVNRGKLTGAPVEEFDKNPLSEDVFKAMRKGKNRDNHMGNFIACVKDRGETQSDVFSHHRNLTTCHLSNIAMRLGRTLKWNPETEQIVGDDEANAWQGREQRKGYEVA